MESSVYTRRRKKHDSSQKRPKSTISLRNVFPWLCWLNKHQLVAVGLNCQLPHLPRLTQDSWNHTSLALERNSPCSPQVEHSVAVFPQQQEVREYSWIFPSTRKWGILVEPSAMAAEDRDYNLTEEQKAVKAKYPPLCKKYECEYF